MIAKIDYVHVHAVADDMITYANSFKRGYVKHWKAHGICVTIAELANIGTNDIRDGDRIDNYVANCLEMEGFTKETCNLIATWIKNKLF